MKIRSIAYQIKQGLKNIYRNRLFSLASVATIAACIFLFGVFYSLFANFQFMVKQAESEICVTVFFDEDLTEQQMKQIGDTVSKRSEVSRVHYTSADEAWENFKKEYFADYEYLAEGFKDDNPLASSASYEVYLTSADQQNELVSYLEKLDGVRQVNRSEEVANSLSSAARLIGLVSVAIVAILLAVSIFLITNTIVIGITVRKEEISVMKYVGATDAFVDAPFFVEGIVIGLVGSVIPMVILYFMYNGIISYVLSQFSALQSILAFLPATEVFNILTPVAIVLGIVIGILGSFFALRKHGNV